MTGRLVLLIVMLSMIGCATNRTMTQATPSNIARKLDVGDEVEIITRDRRIWMMTITALDSESITGRAEGQIIAISLADIDEIRYREVSVVKSLGGTVLTIVSLFGLWVVYVLATL